MQRKDVTKSLEDLSFIAKRFSGLIALGDSLKDLEKVLGHLDGYKLELTKATEELAAVKEDVVRTTLLRDTMRTEVAELDAKVEAVRKEEAKARADLDRQLGRTAKEAEEAKKAAHEEVEALKAELTKKVEEVKAQLAGEVEVLEKRKFDAEKALEALRAKI